MRGTRGRGEPASVTREQIVDVAEALARDAGLDNVTVRRITSTLGITPGAIYWHLADKNEIVRALVDRAAFRVERPGAEFGTWLDRLIRFYLSTREEFTAYAGLSRALMQAEPTDGTMVACLYVLDLLTDAGFDEHAAVGLFDSLSMMSWGHLMLIDAALTNRTKTRGEAVTEFSDHVAHVLETKPAYAVFARHLAELDDERNRQQLIHGIDLLARAAAADAGVPAPPSSRFALAT